ncbi:hypothetical protein, partial [Hoeflea sp.]|uniref:hypothetical protein n=1 Tax=Hoeflea sp. TaxID=1940281 RepID=UPI0025BC3497
MPRKEPERATHAGFDDVEKETRRPEAAAQRGKALLTCQMRGLILCCVVGVPRFCAHAGTRDQLRNLVVRNSDCGIQNRHPTIDDIERQMLSPADFWTDHPIQDC